MTVISNYAVHVGLAGPASVPRVLVGADISGLPQMEARGALFRDKGQARDAVTLMADHGWNCFRLRLFVDPDGRFGAVNSLTETISLAKRIKIVDATLILDLHYSDTWADPQHQIKPRAWAQDNFDQLESRVEQYTSDVLRQMREAGVSPDIVQIGNEVTGGTLWPDAQVQVPPSAVKVYDADVQPVRVRQPYDDAAQWARFARILKAGGRAVRAASTVQHPIRVLIHIDCGGDWPVTRWYCDHLQQAAVDYDILGQSYYPNWHGTLANVRENFRQIADRYRKDILVVETSYPWKNQDYWGPRKNMSWPVSAQGQAQFLSDLLDAVRETPGGHGLGVVYWNPDSRVIPGRVTSAWEGGAMSLFDDNGDALPALQVVK